MCCTDRRVRLFMVWTVIACLTSACAQATPKPTPVPSTAVPGLRTATLASLLWQTYSNPVLGISLEYPASWERSPGDVERYGGVSGFFEIQLISSETMTIDEVASSVLWDKIKGWADPGRTERLSPRTGGPPLRIGGRSPGIRGGAGLVVGAAPSAGPDWRTDVQLPRIVGRPRTHWRYCQDSEISVTRTAQKRHLTNLPLCAI
jgi:hypothetical protein